MSTPVNVQTADERAVAAMLNHHAELRQGLDDRVAALRVAVQDRATYDRPLVALSEFVDHSVLPHATAEEATLYAVAATYAPLFIEAMKAEHRAIAEQAHALVHVDSAVAALAVAEGVAAVFALHVDKENNLLLPLLARESGVSLAELLEAMHDHVEEPAEHQHEDAAAGELDVRTLPHGGGRHEAIFARLDALQPGGRLVIVNDHDPRPLRFQLDAAWPGRYAWDYVQAGPQVWRVAITYRA